MSTTNVINIEACLTALGASQSLLSEADKACLDEQGYVIFYGLMDSEWVERLSKRYEQIMEEEGDHAGALDNNLEPGTRRPSDLVNKGEVFDGMYTHPKVLAAIHYILKRDFKLSNYCGRDALPGMGQQGFHTDWGNPIEENESYHVVNTAWLIDDFTELNGATRVIPGSHKWYGPMDNHYKFESKIEKHPNQVLLEAPKGSVVVFNSHLWHSGTQNNSGSTRRGIFAYFCAREHKSYVDHQKHIRQETLDRISDAAKYMLEL